MSGTNDRRLGPRQGFALVVVCLACGLSYGLGALTAAQEPKRPAGPVVRFDPVYGLPYCPRPRGYDGACVNR